MLKFEKYELPNGLRVILHQDPSTPLATVNILVGVGARDENPDHTGFAHLFEHLMFGGTPLIPEYDSFAQSIGAENNAFTSNDFTNYYITVPAQNLEAALYLEADRMREIELSERSLEVQRKVVIEEFKQRYLNQPYGDAWLELRPLAYSNHPYRWATIGKEIEHIEKSKLSDVKHFFETFYVPQNSILSISGNIDIAQTKEWIEVYFNFSKEGNRNPKSYEQDFPSRTGQRKNLERNVPQNAFYWAFPIVARHHPDYYATDLISDILGRGKSSRLKENWLKNTPLFSQINAYVTGDEDPGLMVIQGNLLPHVSWEEAEHAIWSDLNQLIQEPISDYALEKIKNQYQTSQAFSNIDSSSIALNLAYFEWLEDASLIHQEDEKYMKVSPADIQRMAIEIFNASSLSSIYYHSKS
jgi:zinc protease